MNEDKKITAATSQLQYFIEDVQRELDYARKEVESWLEKAKSDPVYHFGWAEGAFRDTARVAVLSGVVEFASRDQETLWKNGILTENDTESDGILKLLGIILEHAEEMALSGARSPKCSTSPTANVYEMYVTAAWAEIRQKTKRAVNRLAKDLQKIEEYRSDECPKCSNIGAGPLCKAHRAEEWPGDGAFVP